MCAYYSEAVESGLPLFVLVWFECEGISTARLPGHHSPREGRNQVISSYPFVVLADR